MNQVQQKIFTLLIIGKTVYKLDSGLIHFKSCLPLLSTDIISNYHGAYLFISTISGPMPSNITQGISSQMGSIPGIFLTLDKTTNENM